MMSPEMIQRILLSCDWPENKISQEIIIPCLNQYSMRNGFQLRDVRFTGGTSELGNDIEYYEYFGPDMLRFYTGIQVKIGNIGQAEATNLVAQGSQAFEKDITDASNGQTYRINRWVVVATGEITLQAKDQIIQQLERYAKPIHFWDGKKISTIILENYYREFVEKLDVDQLTASSQNVRSTLWDPDQPRIIEDDFYSMSFKKLNAYPAAPPTTSGMYITIKPTDRNFPSTKCVIRSSIDEITIDSVQSQLQPYLLKTEGTELIEARSLEKNRRVHIYCRGYIVVL